MKILEISNKKYAASENEMIKLYMLKTETNKLYKKLQILSLPKRLKIIFEFICKNEKGENK